MTAVTTQGAAAARPNYKRRRVLSEVGALAVAVVLIIWTLAPLYNMVMVSLSSHSDVFSDRVWPADPSAMSYWIVLSEGYWYLEYFWHQYANSVYIGFWTVFLTLGDRLS